MAGRAHLRGGRRRGGSERPRAAGRRGESRAARWRGESYRGAFRDRGRVARADAPARAVPDVAGPSAPDTAAPDARGAARPAGTRLVCAGALERRGPPVEGDADARRARPRLARALSTVGLADGDRRDARA